MFFTALEHLNRFSTHYKENGPESEKQEEKRPESFRDEEKWFQLAGGIESVHRSAWFSCGA